MVFWHLTIDANDPVLLARFWEQALGYPPAPPASPATTWNAHDRGRLGDEAAFADRLFDPEGLRELRPLRRPPAAASSVAGVMATADSCSRTVRTWILATS